MQPAFPVVSTTSPLARPARMVVVFSVEEPDSDAYVVTPPLLDVLKQALLIVGPTTKSVPGSMSQVPALPFGAPTSGAVSTSMVWPAVSTKPPAPPFGPPRAVI